MSLQHHGLKSRGDLDGRRNDLLVLWRLECEKLAKARAEGTAVSYQEANVHEALLALVGALNGAGEFVLHLPTAVSTRDGGKMPDGYYRCFVLTAKAGGADERRTGGTDERENVSLIRLKLMLRQPSGKTMVRVQLTPEQLGAIYIPR